MNSCSPMLLLYLAIGGALPGIALAQPVRVTHQSLEARLASAKGVFRGTISTLDRKVTVPRGGVENGTSWPDGWAEYTFTLHIDEVLLGEADMKLALFKKTSATDRRLDQWFEERTPFLWMVGAPSEEGDERPRPKAVTAAWDFVRLGKPVAAEKAYGPWYWATPFFAMDLSVLATPEAALARARVFAKTKPVSQEEISLSIPAPIAAQVRSSGYWNTFVVPVVPALEPIARRWITAPQDFAPKDSKLDDDSRAQLQLAGIDSLRHFKSDANRELLKPLLDDPYQMLIAIGDDSGLAEAKDKTVRHYPLRELAHEVLTEWGDKIPKPVTEIQVPKK